MMESMRLIHLTGGGALLFFHLLFLIRALIKLRTGEPPGRLDRFARNMAQGLLIPVITLGLIARPGEESSLVTFFIHLIPGTMALGFFFIFALMPALKRRMPAMLPLINGGLLLAAFLTGVLL